MKKLTFQEAYNKIVKAYMRNELDPLIPCKCFIGNLLNRSGEWASARNWPFSDNTFGNPYISNYINTEKECRVCVAIHSNDTYTLEEIIELERVFLMALGGTHEIVEENMKDEEILFEAMEVTLEALKQLHISKGEVIQDYSFKKRELCY